MATTPAAPNDGHPAEGTANRFHADLSGPHLRLVHAHEIAPTRLDDATAGSLDEAVGTEPMPKTPPAEPGLVARAEAAREEPVAARPADAPPPAADGPAPTPHLSDAPDPYAATDGAQSTQAPRAPRLADALSVASQLSADANAAAEALGNLKRMLEQPVSIPGPAPLPQLVLEQDKPRPAAPAAAMPLPPPPPPPQRAPPALEPPRAPPPRPRPTPALAQLAAMRDRVRFDVRGFFAGFALSWAIGAILYLFMTVG